MSKLEMPSIEEPKQPEEETKPKNILEEDPLGKIEENEGRESANLLSSKVAEEVNFVTSETENIKENPGFIKRTKALVIGTLLAGALVGPLGSSAEAQSRGGDRRVQAISGAIRGDDRRGGRHEESTGKVITKEVIRAGAGIYAQKEAIKLANIVQELRIVDQEIAGLQNQLDALQHHDKFSKSNGYREYRNITDAISGKNQNAKDMPADMTEDEKAIEIQNITENLNDLYARKDALIHDAQNTQVKGEIAADIYYSLSRYGIRR